MGHPRNSDKRARIVAAIQAGRPAREVAAEFRCHVSTVRKYLQEFGRGDERNYRGTEPRCGCGLLLPCECGGRLRAEDYMRSGVSMAVISPSLAASFREI